MTQFYFSRNQPNGDREKIGNWKTQIHKDESTESIETARRKKEKMAHGHRDLKKTRSYTLPPVADGWAGAE